MTRKTKARRKPSMPPVDHDHGPATAAQRAGTTTEPVPQDANGRRRKRRLDPVQRAPLKDKLSVRQANAAIELTKAWEACMSSPPAIQEVRVDRSPNPTANIAAQVDRASAFGRLYGVVPSDMRPVVAHVCLDCRGLRDGFSRSGQEAGMHAGMLMVALDLVANVCEWRVK